MQVHMSSPTSARSPHPNQPPQYFGTVAANRTRAGSDAAQGGQQGHFQDLGRGVPLHSVPASWPLYIVEFKAGRTDLFYTTDPTLDVRTGDLVIVEADRGKDLGKVVNDSITLAEVEAFQRQQAAASAAYDEPMSPTASGAGAGAASTSKKEINPKMIYGKAQPQDTHLLVTKMQDEMKALQLCQQKVRQKQLPMEVIDAEYQWYVFTSSLGRVMDSRIDWLW
jgi:cell fate regulator YaaT (PSP1 superfamily)